MTTSNHSRVPRVEIDEMVYQKIMHWVNSSPYEVSGLGKVVVEDGIVRIVSAHLLPQKNSHTTTDIEGPEVGKLMYTTRDEPGELRFWWHSHVSMPVFWSGTDMATINELGANGWFVHVVFNKREETRTAISMGDPFPALIDNIPLFRNIDTSELTAEWDKEYLEKVTNIVPKPTATRGPSGRFQSAHQFKGQGLPNFTADEKAEISRLARLMTEDENPNFPGLGSDGVYGDADSPFGGLRSLSDDEANDSDVPPFRRKSEHDRGESSVPAVLLRRDKLEQAIEAMEEKKRDLEVAGAQIPPKLQRALEAKTEELSEVDEELDALQEAGILSAADRFAPYFGRGPRE